jgi:ubiquinone/menaquinone biosynthesis C-methylase UbiE
MHVLGYSSYRFGRNALSVSKPIAQTPVMFSGISIDPNLRKAWRDPEVRNYISRFATNGMFKNNPDLANRFLNEIDRLSRTPLQNREIYQQLGSFLHSQPDYTFSKSYQSDERSRIGKRVQQIMDFLPKGFVPKRFVDVGCGSGLITEGMARTWAVPKERVHGVEVFERSEAPEAYTHMTYENDRIPLSDNSQDLVTMFMMLHHADRPEHILSEVKRILKPDGLVMIRECDLPTPGVKLFHEVMDHMYYWVFNNLPGVPTPANHLSQQVWEKKFRKAGFVIEKVEKPEPNSPFSPVHFLLKKSK